MRTIKVFAAMPDIVKLARTHMHMIEVDLEYLILKEYVHSPEEEDAPYRTIVTRLRFNECVNFCGVEYEVRTKLEEFRQLIESHLIDGYKVLPLCPGMTRDYAQTIWGMFQEGLGESAVPLNMEEYLRDFEASELHGVER